MNCSYTDLVNIQITYVARYMMETVTCAREDPNWVTSTAINKLSASSDPILRAAGCGHKYFIIFNC